MTLTLTRTRAVPAPTRSDEPAPQLDEARPVPPLSALDRTLDALVRSHDRHATGPVFPCPLCFEPPLPLAR
jgi:hypothetical protein